MACPAPASRRDRGAESPERPRKASCRNRELGESNPAVILAPSAECCAADRSASFDSTGLVIAARDESAVSAVVPETRRFLGNAVLEGGRVGPVLPLDLLETERRFLEQLRGYVGLFGVLLAAVGLGSMVHVRMLSVTGRRTEIGLRRTVGADRGGPSQVESGSASQRPGGGVGETGSARVEVIGSPAWPFARMPRRSIAMPSEERFAGFWPMWRGEISCRRPALALADRVS